jgi:hypothetical protein
VQESKHAVTSDLAKSIKALDPSEQYAPPSSTAPHPAATAHATRLQLNTGGVRGEEMGVSDTQRGLALQEDSAALEDEDAEQHAILLQVSLLFINFITTSFS